MRINMNSPQAARRQHCTTGKDTSPFSNNALPDRRARTAREPQTASSPCRNSHRVYAGIGQKFGRGGAGSHTADDQEPCPERERQRSHIDQEHYSWGFPRTEEEEKEKEELDYVCDHAASDLFYFLH
ncbi:hypothetical protein NDU88_004441 [Pleurodeles waltl]|uniref:Uncharacterized protein n=1 Tax=Pleurodeles waltl TaxID=8319 RepID=A0AAV7WVW6_PLEWA|nr:hypothetical protein NDU88_004441 [Pleurodeles waltl]